MNRIPITSGIAILTIIYGAIRYWLTPSADTLIMLVLVLLLAIIIVHSEVIRRRKYLNKNHSIPTFEQQKREHQLLLESVYHYPMPYAVYNEKNQLIVWNKAYEGIYSQVFSNLEDSNDAKGMAYEDLLRKNVKDGLLDRKMEESIKQRANAHQQTRYKDNQIEYAMTDRHYPDLGWFRVSKYGTPSGGIAGIAININELKQRESELIKEIEHRKKLEIEIRKIANTDVLTELSNRRHFMACAKIDYSNANNAGQSCAVMMIDIDNLKSINDSFGHEAGDEVISTTARIVSTIVTSEAGLAGRLGGEEFAVLLCGCSAEKAHSLAEKIRSSIAGITFVEDGTSYPVTVSIGVALSNKPETTLSNLLRNADNALYESKRTGRNKVTVDKTSTHTEYKKTG